MALTFHPRRGTVLMCDFTTGFQVPEMTKIRPVVVISGTISPGVCTVIPLSTTAPVPPQNWHHLLAPASLPAPFQAQPTWAKCDMVATVSLKRLDRVRIGKDSNGKRLYAAVRINSFDMASLEQCLLHVFCLRHLTKPPS
ncbi:MAG: type II toxin-antitoxin system PemK/MazF family toxin [Planctomycetaceae bacterium]